MFQMALERLEKSAISRLKKTGKVEQVKHNCGLTENILSTGNKKHEKIQKARAKIVKNEVANQALTNKYEIILAKTSARGIVAIVIEKINQKKGNKKMNIEELTVKQVREIASLIGASTTHAANPWVIGKSYVIRTVTMIQYGTLKAIYPTELVLSDAAWIADTGRFADFLKDPSKANEVEPFSDDVIVNRMSVVDAQEVKPFKAYQK